MEYNVAKRPGISLLLTTSMAGKWVVNTDLKVKIQTILVPKGK